MTAAKKKSSAKPKGNGGKSSLKASLRRRWPIWCAAACAVAALLTLFVAWLTFSPYRDYSAPQLGEPHFLLLRRIATELRRNRTRKEAEIRLSPEETGLMLDIVRHASQFVKGKNQLPPPENFILQYRNDGGVRFAIPAEAAGSWCLGGKIYVSGVLYFEKRGDEVIVEMPKLRFGRADLPIPGGLDTWRPSWKDEVKDSLPPEFMTAVKSIYAERDGTVVLVYHPQELRKPLKKSLSGVQDQSTGELRPTLEQLIKAL